MRSLIALAVMLIAFPARSQSPEAFNFQAVARDASGEALTNTTVGVQFQLRQATAGGTVVFAETHAPTTNDHGLFTLAVGTGAPTTGTLTAVDWKAGPYFLEVGLDPAGGSSYTTMGTQQLLSVPYALHAGGDGDWTVTGNNMSNANTGNVGIGTDLPSSPLHVVGDHRVEGSFILDGAIFQPGWDLSIWPSSFNINESNVGPRLTLEPGGNVGINQQFPTANLDVNGTFKLLDGTEGTGRILTSDGEGRASWSLITPEMFNGAGAQAQVDLTCASVIANVPAGSFPYDIAMEGDHVYIVDYFDQTLQAIHVPAGDPGSAQVIASVFAGLGPRSLAIGGDHVFVADNFSQILRAFNVSDPNSPSLVDQIALGSDVFDIVVQGSIAFLVSSGMYDLHVVDISDPSNLSLVTTFPLGGFLGGGGATFMAYHNDHLYINDHFTGDLKIVDVSTPATPSVVNTWPAYGLGGLAIKDGVLYYSDGGLRTFDLSDAANPALMGNYPGAFTAGSIHLLGEFALAADMDHDLLRVFDVGTISAPDQIGQIPIAGSFAVTAKGNHAFVASSNGEVDVVQLACLTGIAYDPLSASYTSVPTGLWTASLPDIHRTAGNVGIGTTSPETPLHVYKANGGAVSLFETLGTGSGGIEVRTGAGGNGYLHFSSGSTSAKLRQQSGKLHLEAPDNSPRLTVDGSNGNVGIGTVSPSNRLSVSGDADVTGNLGVGTTAPNAKLHVVGSALVQAAVPGELNFLVRNMTSPGARTYISSEPSRSLIQTDRDLAFTTSLSNWSTKMTLTNAGNLGIGTTTPTNTLEVRGIGNVLAAYSSSSNAGDTPFLVRSGNGSIECMIVRANGNVGMGITNPGAKLHVNGDIYSEGKIWAREVEVTLASFPDYVFEPDYRLMPLEEVSAYIQEHGHLPNVPSACEVEENGLGLGAMNKILLEKVEELTLHAIEQQRNYSLLEESNLELRAKMHELEQMLNELKK